MSVNFINYSGKSNVGKGLSVNEDFIMITEFDDDMLFASVADGAGGANETFMPASIVTNQAMRFLRRIYNKDQDLFKENTRLFIEEAFLSANNILVGFKLGNEEKFYGYASTLTSATISKDGVLTFGHVGNTRLYLVRNGSVTLLTHDDTEGMELVKKGLISNMDYYKSIEKLNLTNGMGVTPTPSVQTFQFQLKPGDIIIMTSDGIHYSYQDSAFISIIQQSETPDDATEMMIDSALKLNNFKDNISACLLWYTGTEK